MNCEILKCNEKATDTYVKPTRDGVDYRRDLCYKHYKGYIVLEAEDWYKLRFKSMQASIYGVSPQ